MSPGAERTAASHCHLPSRRNTTLELQRAETYDSVSTWGHPLPTGLLDQGGAAGRPGSKRLRVLHVEDGQAVADMYRLGLQLAGFNVTTAPSAATALETASRSDFD